jgi:hypothetical protein
MRVVLKIIAGAAWMVVGSILIAYALHHWAWVEFVRAHETGVCPPEGGGGPCAERLSDLLERRRVQAIIWAVPIAASLLAITVLSCRLVQWFAARQR